MGKGTIGVYMQVAQEAARIVCEEQLADYRLARQKAAERLGVRLKPGVPDNAAIQDAVIEYQRLFGGHAYAEHLTALRRTAVQALRLLAQFQPRLVGAVATGATTDAHLVRLHGFADKPEMIDLFLENHGIPYESSERRYRYSGGRQADIPTCRFFAGDIGIEVAAFPVEELRRPPLSPIDNQPMKRLTLKDVEQLLETPIDLAGGE